MSSEFENTILSPYFIFIKNGFKLSDRELLNKLGLKHYKSPSKKLDTQNMAFLYSIGITEDKNWTHIIYNWAYDLWYEKFIRDNILSLSKEFDIYSCSIGDIDYSFDFRYFKSGKVIREYIVEDPKINGGYVSKNIGTPLNIEDEALKKKDLSDKVLTIAEYLDIDLNHNDKNIRIYQAEKNDDFVFNEDEY